MKKTAIILFSVFFLAAFSASGQMHQGQSAQNDQQQSMMMQNRGMMQGGMMQGMMNKGMCPMCGQMMNQDMPMQKYMMMVNHLPAMHQQLSLSPMQIDQLIDLQADYKKKEAKIQATLAKERIKLQNLLDEKSTASDIQRQMTNCANTKIEMKMAAYETAQKMHDLLSDGQKDLLKDKMNKQGNMMQGGMMNQD